MGRKLSRCPAAQLPQPRTFQVPASLPELMPCLELKKSAEYSPGKVTEVTEVTCSSCEAFMRRLHGQWLIGWSEA